MDKFIRMVALHRRELIVLGDNAYDKKLIKRLDHFDWELCKEFIIRYLKHIARVWSEEYLKFKAYEENEFTTLE